MGVRIVAKGVNAEAFATEYSSPVSRSLEAIHFLNTSLEKAGHNYAPGKKTGSVVGAPVPFAGFTTFKGLSNFIETDISETDSMTFFVLARAELDGTDQSNRAIFMGNYLGSSNPPGCGIYVQNTNRLATFACFGNDAASNSVVASSVNSTRVVTDWNTYVGIVTPGSVTMRNLTTGQIGIVENPTPRRRGLYKLRIGSGYGTYTGKCDIALFQHHSAVLTEGEIQAVYADFKAYALRKGIAG